MFNLNERLKIVAERVTLDLHVQQKKIFQHTFTHTTTNL